MWSGTAFAHITAQLRERGVRVPSRPSRPQVLFLDTWADPRTMVQIRSFSSLLVRPPTSPTRGVGSRCRLRTLPCSTPTREPAQPSEADATRRSPSASTARFRRSCGTAMTNGNPWGVRYPRACSTWPTIPICSRTTRSGRLPLYEGKMFWQFDHRFGTYPGQTRVPGKPRHAPARHGRAASRPEVHGPTPPLAHTVRRLRRRPPINRPG